MHLGMCVPRRLQVERRAAAVTLQRVARGRAARRDGAARLAAVLRLQAVWRGSAARAASGAALRVVCARLRAETVAAAASRGSARKPISIQTKVIPVPSFVLP